MPGALHTVIRESPYNPISWEHYYPVSERREARCQWNDWCQVTHCGWHITVSGVSGVPLHMLVMVGHCNASVNLSNQGNQRESYPGLFSTDTCGHDLDTRQQEASQGYLSGPPDWVVSQQSQWLLRGLMRITPVMPLAECLVQSPEHSVNAVTTIMGFPGG